MKLLQVNTPIKQRLAEGPLNPALAISLLQIYSEQSNNQGPGAHYCRPLCSDVFPAKEETDLVIKPATLYDWGEVTHTRVSTCIHVGFNHCLGVTVDEVKPTSITAVTIHKSVFVCVTACGQNGNKACVSLSVVRMETKHVCH